MEPNDRKRLLEMAERRARPGSGSLPSLVKERGEAYDVSTSVPDLHGVSYAIVGGLATACYMPERMTLDTDILVADETLADVERHLLSGGCERLGSLSVGGSSWRMQGGRVLDVLALRREWVPEALQEAAAKGEGPPFIALRYLVLMKLESGRLQDLADISRMAGFADTSALEETRGTVMQYRPQDAEDLESMIQRGKLEHGSDDRPPA